MNLLNSSYNLFSSLNCGNTCNVVVVSLHNVPETFISVFQAVLFAIILDLTLDKREFVKRNSGEDVMLNLVLHTSANVVKEPVFEVNVSGGYDLMGEVVVNLVFGSGGTSFFRNEFLLSFVLMLSLVTGSDDESGNSSCNKNTQGPDLPGQESNVPGPVNSQTNQLLVVFVGIGPEYRVDLPFDLKDGV